MTVLMFLQPMIAILEPLGVVRLLKHLAASRAQGTCTPVPVSGAIPSRHYQPVCISPGLPKDTELDMEELLNVDCIRHTCLTNRDDWVMAFSNCSETARARSQHKKVVPSGYLCLHQYPEDSRHSIRAFRFLWREHHARGPKR